MPVCIQILPHTWEIILCNLRHKKLIIINLLWCTLHMSKYYYFTFSGQPCIVDMFS